MMEITIEEMNEAIAIFEGWKRDGEKYIKNPEGAVYIHGAGYDSQLKYHESWEWLMKVIEKISKIPLLNWDNTVCTDPQDVCWPRTFGMPTEDGKRIMFRFNGFSLHEAETLIEAAYMAVYEVAEYHNKQKER